MASAVIGDTFPPEKRGGALGLIGAVFGFAFIIGPILGGVLLLAGWHWLFLVNLPIAAALIVLSLRILPADRPGTAGPFDLPGMAPLGPGLAAFAFGVNRIETGRFLASLVSLAVLPFLAAVALLLLPAAAGLKRCAQELPSRA